MRLFSILSGTPAVQKVKHYVGLPPELTGGTESRFELGVPVFLVIEERSDGIFLYRFDRSGQCVGDTWHMNVDDAKHQAAYEFEGVIEGWKDVPKDTEDVVAFCLAQKG